MQWGRNAASSPSTRSSMAAVTSTTMPIRLAKSRPMRRSTSRGAGGR